MAKGYLEQLSALIARARNDRLKKVDLDCKHFFSGAAVYVNGRICMSLTPVGFAMKLPQKSRAALLKQNGAKPLRYFPKGPIKKDYVVLPDSILNDTNALRRWVRICVDHVALSPKPATKKPVTDDHPRLRRAKTARR